MLNNTPVMQQAVKRYSSLALIIAGLTACTGAPTSSSSGAASSTNTAPSSSSITVSSSSSSAAVVSSSSAMPPSSSSLSSIAPSSSSASSMPSYDIPSNNFAENGDVENGTTHWGARGDAQIARTTADKYAGSASLLVTDRGDYWHGATFNVGRLTAGNMYEVAAWVKLAAGEPETILKITGKRVDDADTDTYLEYTGVASETVTADGWTLLVGTYVPDGATDFESFIVEAEDGSDNVSFYVDNFVVAGEVEDEPVITPPPAGSGLKDLTNIPIGVEVNLERGSKDTLNSPARVQIVRDNFNQVTAENNMKMSYWSGANYSNQQADRLATWAKNNNTTIHGHTLVWHPCYQLPSWANDQTGTAYQQSLTNHIRGVASQHTDTIVSWDVVNEALFDTNDEGSYSGCRYQTGGAVVNGVNYRRSAHYEGMGAGYIELAFREADKVTNADLYYNDFNTEENGAKTDSLIALLKDLNSKNVPIDGVGFQMHVLPDYASMANIKASWQKVLDLNYGLKIKITELDVRVNNPYAPGWSYEADAVKSCSDTQALARQKARYKDIVKAYYEVVPAELRGGITVWGISDSDSWFKTISGGGRDDIVGCPLLFNDNLQAKPAYEGVKEALNESN